MKGLFFTIALACFAISMNVAVPIDDEPVQPSEDNDIAKKKADACKLFNNVINLVLFDGFKGNDTAMEVIKGCYGKYLNNLYGHVCEHALGEDADVQAAALEMHTAEEYCQMLEDYIKAKNDNDKGDDKQEETAGGVVVVEGEGPEADTQVDEADTQVDEADTQVDEADTNADANAEVVTPSNDGEASEKSKLSHVKSKGVHNKNKNSHNKNKNSHNKSKDSHKKSKNSHSKSKNSHSKSKNSHSKSKGSHNKNKEGHHQNANH